MPHTTGRNKADPEMGFSSIASDIEFGRVRLPHASGLARVLTSRFIDEAVNWTSPRDTDDQLLALWFLKVRHRSLSPPHVQYAKAQNGWTIPPRLHGKRWTR